MAKVSIIVPVYNGAEFLPGAVESVLCQTCGDWEMLLVDDGSTDGVTPSLCDTFALRDKRIHVFHKENGGLSDARNHALPHAKGQYIAFLDADDLLHPDFVRVMLATASETAAEIVFGAYDYFTNECLFAPVPAELPITLEDDTRKIARKMLYQTGYSNTAWGKLYDRHLWQEFRFPKGLYYEDLHTIHRVILAASKIAVIGHKLYGYRQHPKSFLHVWSEHRLDVLDVTDEIVRWVAKNAPEISEAAADRRMSAHFNILLELYKNKIDRPEVEQRCLRVIRQQRVASLRNSQVRPKNRIGALTSLLFGRRMLKFLAHFC